MKVFVSHSSTDAGLARKLAIDLKAVGLDVWLDQWELEVGEEIAQTIENGVGVSDFVLVLLSQKSMKSTWVNREWRLKVLAEAETQKTAIIPVRCEPCEIPDFLAQRSATDISGGSYPLGFDHLLDILGFYAETEIRLPIATTFGEELLSWFKSPILVPVQLLVGSNLIPLCDDKSTLYTDLIPQIREEFRLEYGFSMPGIRVVGNDKGLRHNSVLISIEEVNEVWFEIAPEVRVVKDSDVQLASLGVSTGELKLGKIGTTFTYFSRDGGPAVEKAGFESWDAAQFIAMVIKMIAQKHAPLFMGIDVAHQLVETVRLKNTQLVEKTIPNIVSWIELTDILRRLVEEDIPVTNMPKILKVLSRQKAGIQNTVHLTELVRQGLGKQLTKSILKGDHQLYAMQLDQKLEAYIAGTIQNTSVGPFIHLDSEVANLLLTAIRRQVSGISHRNLIIIVHHAILRKFLRKLVELEFPWLRAFSFKELHPEIKIKFLPQLNLPSEVLKTYPIEEPKK